MTSSIKEALEILDPADDEQWTEDGLPLVEIVRELTGNQNLKRKDITDAAPLFTRENSEPNEDLLKVVDAEIEELIAKRDEIANRLHRLFQRRNQLYNEKARSTTPAKEAEARQAFIKRQNQNRQERHAKVQALLATGLKPSDLDPRTPLDQAFAKKKRQVAQQHGDTN